MAQNIIDQVAEARIWFVSETGREPETVHLSRDLINAIKENFNHQQIVVQDPRADHPLRVFGMEIRESDSPGPHVS